MSLLLFIIFTVFSISVAASKPDTLLGEIKSLSEKLDQLELILNQSIDNILTKIDEKNYDLKSTIISHFATEHSGSNNNSHNKTISALLIIDVQNDFIDGSLSLRNCPSKHNGEEVIPVINNLLDTVRFDVVVYSYDWHPKDHISFFDNLPLRSHLLTNDSKSLEELSLYSSATFDIPGVGRVEQTFWPRHCVQNSFGAKVHRDLKVMQKFNTHHTSVVNIYKGTKPNIDSYSAFWDNSKLSETMLNKKLQEKHVNQIFVTGLATDWCVYSTAVHAMEYGYRTFIVEDACRGVDEKMIKDRLDDFKQKNGHVIKSHEVQDYLS